MTGNAGPGMLAGLRVIEIADERAEYTEAKVGRRVEVVFEKLNDDITLPQFRLPGMAPAEPPPFPSSPACGAVRERGYNGR